MVSQVKAPYPGFLTDVPGFSLGHAQNAQWATGVSVVVAPDATVGGVDVRGGAPGSRETDVLRPENAVSTVNAVVLAGGSAFGLAAASGVMEALAQQKKGIDTGFAYVPIVPSCVLYDLCLGRSDAWPTAEMGKDALAHATCHDISMGNIGAGCGASVSKICGMQSAVKSGLGQASRRVGELVVSCAIAVNAMGDVFDPERANMQLTGPGIHNGRLLKTIDIFSQPNSKKEQLIAKNTSIGCIATNALLDKAGCQKVAQMAHDGLARTIYPVHTLSDGDTLFALASGTTTADANLVGIIAAEVVQKAVVNAVMSASGAYGLPAATDLCELEACSFETPDGI